MHTQKEGPNMSEQNSSEDFESSRLTGKDDEMSQFSNTVSFRSDQDQVDID